MSLTRAAPVPCARFCSSYPVPSRIPCISEPAFIHRFYTRAKPPLAIPWSLGSLGRDRNPPAGLPPHLNVIAIQVNDLHDRVGESLAEGEGEGESGDSCARPDDGD